MTTTSLRDRKRRATKTAIQDCATALVMDKGVDNVTVEDICDAAGISRRTFFNYVDSKESAILGDPPRALTEAEISEFISVQHPDLCRAVIRLAGLTTGFVGADGIFDATCPLECSERAARLLRRRKTIVRSWPEMSAQRFGAKFQSFASITHAVTAYYRAHPERQLLETTPEKEAEAVVFLTSSAIQMGVHDWMAGDDASLESLADHFVSALDRLRTLSERSIRL